MRSCNECVIIIANRQKIREISEIISKMHDSVVLHWADNRL